VFLQDAREVELGAGGGGDRDAVAGRDLVRGENGSVEEEPAALGSRPLGRDLDPAVPRAEAPQSAGRSVAEHAAGGERGGHPAPVLRDDLVAHRVHPAVKRVELARSHASSDRARAHAHREQLISSDDAMLPRGQVADDHVRRKVAYFFPLSGTNQATLAHAPDHADENATELTPSVPKFEHHSPNTLMTNRLSRPPSNSA
jgi:hypothetical protein